VSLDDIDARPDAPYATVLGLLRAHCHPDAGAAGYLALVLRAHNPPDAEMARFKAELRDLLCGGVRELPAGALYAAALYDDDEDEDFLRRLWWDLFDTEPATAPGKR
jgi:hypothetical protein